MLELDFKNFLEIASKNTHLQESYLVRREWLKEGYSLEWVTEDSYIIVYTLRSFSFHGEPPKFERIEYIMRVACKVRLHTGWYLFGYIVGGGRSHWGMVLATSNKLRWVSKDKALDKLAVSSL